MCGGRNLLLCPGDHMMPMLDVKKKEEKLSHETSVFVQPFVDQAILRVQLESTEVTLSDQSISCLSFCLIIARHIKNKV